MQRRKSFWKTSAPCVTHSASPFGNPRIKITRGYIRTSVHCVGSLVNLQIQTIWNWVGNSSLIVTRSHCPPNSKKWKFLLTFTSSRAAHISPLDVTSSGTLQYILISCFGTRIATFSPSSQCSHRFAQRRYFQLSYEVAFLGPLNLADALLF